MSNAPAGWYDDGSGRQRWWDGNAWTDAYAAPQAAPGAPAAPKTAPIVNSLKGLGIAALVAGIVAFLLGLVPVLGILLGLGAAAVAGFALLKRAPKGLAVTGLVLAGLATIASISTTSSLITGIKPITSESVSVPDKPEKTPAAKSTTTPEPKESPRVSEEPEEAEKPEKTQTPEPTKEAEIQPGLTDDEKSAMLDEDLKFALFVESSYQELLAVDPSLWGGYLVGVRVEGSDAYFMLQVDRSTPEGKDLGQRAAQALSTLLTQETVDELGISWVIVEDGAGVVIDQKMSSPLI